MRHRHRGGDRAPGRHPRGGARPRERDLLASLARDTGEPEALWFTRFWAAKEAVGKAGAPDWSGPRGTSRSPPPPAPR
ncbi:4'-phosphopantetheinyl transferase superfamily protein [Streptomyces sp. M19]